MFESKLYKKKAGWWFQHPHGAFDKTGGFKDFVFFSPQIGEMIQFDKQHIFQIGWFKHHPESHQHRPVLKVS